MHSRVPLECGGTPSDSHQLENGMFDLQKFVSPIRMDPHGLLAGVGSQHTLGAETYPERSLASLGDPHHRWCIQQLNPEFPLVADSISIYPNSQLGDINLSNMVNHVIKSEFT